MTATTDKPLSKKTQAEHDKARYAEQLREMLPPGSTAYTILDSVSRSGMSRKIRVVAMQDGEPLDISGRVAVLCGYKRDDRSGALKVGGCGMDMGFSVVYGLSHALYPDGFTCAGETCRSNDHSNGDRDRTPHHHQDGGYAVSHRWL